MCCSSDIILALYFYEKLLVCVREVDFIWRRKDVGIVVPVIYGTMHASTVLLLLLALYVPASESCEVGESL